MEYSVISYTLAEGVATLTLNRPEVMNALNGPMRAELLHALMRARGEARCIVLTGTGRAFCSGQDLSDPSLKPPIDFQGILTREYEPMILAITQSPVPVIAAVNGAAAGAGANLALAADVVIATESASFIQAFSKIALIPDAGGTYWLPRQIGMARAMGACLFAEKVSARQAADWGMIWEAVPDDSFAATVAARAAHLASGPTGAYAALKRAMQASAANDLQSQLRVEAEEQGRCGGSADFYEGVAAFLGKRAPAFRGK